MKSKPNYFANESYNELNNEVKAENLHISSKLKTQYKNNLSDDFQVINYKDCIKLEGLSEEKVDQFLRRSTEDAWGYYRDFPGENSDFRINDNNLDLKAQEAFIMIHKFKNTKTGKNYYRPIGMFALDDKKSNTLDNEKIAFLTYVYVDRSYRNLGLGCFMLENAKKQAANLGYNNIDLGIVDFSLDKFYTKFGAKLIGEQNIHLKDSKTKKPLQLIPEDSYRIMLTRQEKVKFNNQNNLTNVEKLLNKKAEKNNITFSI